jgi:7,8-dihydropterin-6-yl-methyl-4-(beta-D-ribofuranosyl)aminobenzene 5'-phosphate synthase
MCVIFAAAALLVFLAPISTAAEFEIAIAYDNTAASNQFTDDWGFAAVVTTPTARVLFDSGTDPELLLSNLAKLDIAPTSITHTIISHHHADHLGGIYRVALRNSEMKVFFLDSFPAQTYETAMAVGMAPQRVRGPQEIAPGIYTTGPIGESIPEQALIVDTAEGPVVLVGCSHPGLTTIIKAVEEQRGLESVRLLLGGFHMIRLSEEQILEEIQSLKTLHVRAVAPMHCTGERSKRLFRKHWGAEYKAGGVGRRIRVE